MKAKKTSSVFSFSLWLGFREKGKEKGGLFANKWYPSTAVSLNKTKPFTQKHGTAPSTGLSTPWHINHDQLPCGHDRASFCFDIPRAALYLLSFYLSNMTFSLSINYTFFLLHWLHGVPQGSPFGPTMFSLSIRQSLCQVFSFHYGL